MARWNKIQCTERRLIQLFVGGVCRITAGQYARDTGGVCGAEYRSDVEGTAQVI